MNPTRALLLVFLFGSMAFSQTSGKKLSSGNSRTNCPIELKASFNSAGKIVPIAPADKGVSAGNEQRLQITLSNPEANVVAESITVHGFPVGGRVDPAVFYLTKDPAEITRTIAFDQTVAAGQSASFAVAEPNFSTVTLIDLDSVTYSDGSSWHPGNRKYCRAVSSPMDAAVGTRSR